MKKMNELELSRVSGGQVESCQDFELVMLWLVENGHYEQLEIITDLFYAQYCLQ